VPVAFTIRTLTGSKPLTFFEGHRRIVIGADHGDVTGRADPKCLAEIVPKARWYRWGVTVANLRDGEEELFCDECGI
jgi:hypothetical protein